MGLVLFSTSRDLTYGNISDLVTRSTDDVSDLSMRAVPRAPFLTCSLQGLHGDNLSFGKSMNHIDDVPVCRSDTPFSLYHGQTLYTTLHGTSVSSDVRHSIYASRPSLIV